MNTARYHKEVQDGVRLNVVWAAVTEELERDALPVRIPIRKGILGYRIFLVRRYMAMDVILPYVVWITLLAWLMDLGLRQVTRLCFPWYEGVKA